jgi:hypothetical protein
MTSNLDEKKYSWDDSIMNEIKHTMNVLRTVYYERSQLYGGIITSMLRSGVTEFTMTAEELQEIGERYYLLFTPENGGKEVRMTLMSQEHTPHGE